MVFNFIILIFYGLYYGLIYIFIFVIVLICLFVYLANLILLYTNSLKVNEIQIFQNFDFFQKSGLWSYYGLSTV